MEFRDQFACEWWRKTDEPGDLAGNLGDEINVPVVERIAQAAGGSCGVLPQARGS